MMFHEHETSEYSDFFIIVSNRFGEIFLSKRLKVDFFMDVILFTSNISTHLAYTHYVCGSEVSTDPGF